MAAADDQKSGPAGPVPFVVTEPCPVCDGQGKIDGQPCLTCHGTGARRLFHNCGEKEPG